MSEYDEKQWHDFPKLPKLTILPWLLWALAAGLAIAGVLYAARVHSVEIPLHVLEKENVEIRLMGTPCVDAASIAQIRPLVLHRFRAIESVWPEKDGTSKAYAGCWAELTSEEAGEEVFLLVFSDGASGGIPKSEFRKVKGQSGA